MAEVLPRVPVLVSLALAPPHARAQPHRAPGSDRSRRENVFAPLGMSSTGSYKQFLRGNHASGYEGEGPRQHEAQATVTEYEIPSGGLVSTIADVLKLNAALLAQTLMKDSVKRSC